MTIKSRIEQGGGITATVIESGGSPVMTGATAEKDGKPGLVPKPATGQHEHFLRADGTFQAIEIPEDEIKTFNQYLPSTVWTIPHSFPHPPDVRVTETSGDPAIGEVTHPNSTTVQIAFSAPVAGRARLF